MSRSPARVLDEYLVAAARTGDRRAFALLAERWHGKLTGHAWRLLGDRETAQDAAQGAWVEILRGLAGLKDERAFPAWAFRIVSRRCARQVDAACRQRDLIASLSREPELPPSEPGCFADADRLRAAMELLPREQKSALALFYLEEMSVAEVAVALDVPLGTVKTRLMHARGKLRGVLQGDDNA